MTFVIGRGEGDGNENRHRATAHLGEYRALDGSKGASLGFDIDGPHAVLIVGKRGYGKSYTLGVLAEELARCERVAPVVVDPMGAFATLGEAGVNAADPVPATVVENPRVVPSALDPRSWCSLLGLSPEGGAGGLVWQAAAAADTLAGMADHVASADARTSDTRAAVNHIGLAESWDVFDPDGLSATDLGSTEITVLDVSHLDPAPMNAVVRAAGEALYRARLTDALARLPWLLVDEAHTFFEGIAAGALERILARGRAPGVSLVVATQRPSDVPSLAISQSDTVIAHRLTSKADRDALREARPADLGAALAERTPEDPGDAIVVDDATETVHTARIRRRETPHGGGSPSVGESQRRP